MSISERRVSDKIDSVSRKVFAALAYEFESQYFAFRGKGRVDKYEGLIRYSIRESCETHAQVLTASVTTSWGEVRSEVRIDPLTAMTSYGGAQYISEIATGITNDIGEKVFKHEWRRIPPPIMGSEPSRREPPKVEETIYETIDIPMMDGTIRREAVRHTSDLHPTPHPKVPEPEEKIERNADFGTW